MEFVSYLWSICIVGGGEAREIRLFTETQDQLQIRIRYISNFLSLDNDFVLFYTHYVGHDCLGVDEKWRSQKLLEVTETSVSYDKTL